MVLGVQLHSQTASRAFAGRRGPRATAPEQTQAAPRGDPHPRQPHLTVPLRSRGDRGGPPARSQGDLEESGNLASRRDAAPGEVRPPESEWEGAPRSWAPAGAAGPCQMTPARTVPSAKGLRSRKWPPQCPSRQHGVGSGSVSIRLCGAACEEDSPIPLSSRSGTFLPADFAEDAAPWSGAENRSRPPRSCWVVEKVEGGQVLSATVKIKIIIIKNEWVSYLLILTINRVFVGPFDRGGSHLEKLPSLRARPFPVQPRVTCFPYSSLSPPLIFITRFPLGAGI
uniref:Uncharacterized protein n=1 Tax=Nomascus leucogenys TaxID=61853 RepID=G1R816_NOMLE